MLFLVLLVMVLICISWCYCILNDLVFIKDGFQFLACFILLFVFLCSLLVFSVLFWRICPSSCLVLICFSSLRWPWCVSPVSLYLTRPGVSTCLHSPCVVKALCCLCSLSDCRTCLAAFVTVPLCFSRVFWFCCISGAWMLDCCFGFWISACALKDLFAAIDSLPGFDPCCFSVNS